MKHPIANRVASWLLVAAMVLSLFAGVYTPEAKAAGIVAPGGSVLIAETSYTIAKGVTETDVILNNPSGTAQVMGYLHTISPDAQVVFKASYGEYYSEGSTPESRAEKVGNLPFDMVSTTKQAAAYEAATGGNVLVQNVIPKHMECITSKLQEMGARNVLVSMAENGALLLDESGKNITKEIIRDLVPESELKNISYDDLLISMMISVAPKKIIVKNKENIKNKQLFKTLEKAFLNVSYN